MYKLYNGLCVLLFIILLSNDCVVINEIHYNPDIDQNQADEDYEFVELYNQCDDTVNISHWSLYRHDNCWGCYYDEIYQFDNNVHMEPHQYIVLAHNSNYYPGSLDWGDEFLPNYGTELILVDSSCNGYNIKDYVHYDDYSPWPTSPDGHGPSLELVNSNFDNANADSWQASYITGGTPGAMNSSFEDDDSECSELNYWDCLSNNDCDWISDGWWGGYCNDLEDNLDWPGFKEAFLDSECIAVSNFS